MTIYHLYRWSLCDLLPPDPYRAPELQRACLSGYRDQQMKRIVTSPIMKVNGREIQTMNNTYILEDIDPEYLQWMHDNGFTYDSDNPIPKKK